MSIESLSIKVDFKTIQKTYPQAIVVPHTVYHTPDWVLFFRQYISLADETKLCSDEWVTGGETWTYTGRHSPVDGDEIPKDFQELDDLLREICPNISHLQYKHISSDCVTVVEREESDYYSRLIKQCFVCDLEKLYEALCSFGYIRPSDQLEAPSEIDYTAIARELSEFTLTQVSGKNVHPDICDRGAAAIRTLLAENEQLRRGRDMDT